MPQIPPISVVCHRVKGSKRRGRNLSNAYHAKLLVAAQRLGAHTFVAAPLPSFANTEIIEEIKQSEIRRLTKQQRLDRGSR